MTRASRALCRPDVLTVGQVARVLRCATRTVTRFTDTGHLPHYRIPRQGGPGDRRIRRQDLIAFMRQHGFPIEGEMSNRVLLVSRDDALILRMADLCSEDGECNCRTATSWFDAGIQFVRFSPQAVVFDFALGRSESLAEARGLRATDRTLRLIALAGEDESEAGMLGLSEWGFTDVLRRPVDPVALVALAKEARK